jgi:hypothetical protein
MMVMIKYTKAQATIKIKKGTQLSSSDVHQATVIVMSSRRSRRPLIEAQRKRADIKIQLEMTFAVIAG